VSTRRLERACTALAPALLLASLASFANPPAFSPRIEKETTGFAEPAPAFPLRKEAARAEPRDACARSAFGLCYNLADKRVVYTPARQYMPRIEGLTAESISLRRNAIRFNYSFP
jgi:hypothetical protein